MYFQFDTTSKGNHHQHQAQEEEEEDEDHKPITDDSQLLNPLQNDSASSVFLEADNQGGSEGEPSYTVIVDESHLTDIVPMESVVTEDPASPSLHLAQTEV